MIAIAVNCFETESSRNVESTLSGTRCSTSA